MRLMKNFGTATFTYKAGQLPYGKNDTAPGVLRVFLNLAKDISGLPLEPRI